jgi:hypothetical protein
MAGAPGFQKIKGLGAANLTDRNTVGTEPERGADQIGKRRATIFGAQGNEVGRGTLQLAGIFYQHHTVAGLGDLGEERIDQGGFASRGAADDQDVLPFPDRCPQQLGVCAGHDAGLDIIAESEDRDGGPANGEARRGNNGWDQTLEPLPALRKLAIAVPSAVRNMRAPRAKASDQNAVAITSNPVKAPRRGELISGVD